MKQIPEKPGVYSLVITKFTSEKIRIGKLGTFYFPIGHYSYTGSALGTRHFNLKKRLSHHLNIKKRSHWHIDYFLRSRRTSIRRIIIAETSQPLECEISSKIEQIPYAIIIAPGFGSTDCTKQCRTHLHYFEKNSLIRIVKRIAKVLTEVNISPKILTLDKNEVD